MFELDEERKMCQKKIAAAFLLMILKNMVSIKKTERERSPTPRPGKGKGGKGKREKRFSIFKVRCQSFEKELSRRKSLEQIKAGKL